MAFDTIQYERDGGLAWITLNRPQKLNTLNQQLLTELGQALDRVQMDPGIRVILLTGAGEKAFAAGADISELTELTPLTGRKMALDGQSLMRRFELFPKPVIAVINGLALGGGLELALACTFRIASETARLGQPEVKLGLIPGYGGTQRLPRLIGTGPALEMLLGGEPVSAARALQLGLVNQVSPTAELRAAATQFAHKLAALSPWALRLCLEAVRRGMETSLSDGLQLEASLFALACGTGDMREGTQAFLEKRAPRFADPDF